MTTYNIYHPFMGAINHFCRRGVYEYQHVGSVRAYNLESAFKQAQNDFNAEYAKLGVRSTCVGDIISEEGSCQYFMVKSVGFEEVPHTVLSYIDWSNHMNTDELRWKMEESLKDRDPLQVK